MHRAPLISAASPTCPGAASSASRPAALPRRLRRRQGVGDTDARGRRRLHRRGLRRPRSTLAYWNGFTGGDGPTMQELVKQFNGEHDNITIKNNTVEWADFYQRLPGRRAGRQGPRRRRRCTSTSWPRTPPAACIVPLDDLAEALGLSEERLRAVGVGARASTRTSATASRSTCTRSAMYYNKDHFDKAGIDRGRRPTRPASTRPARRCSRPGIEQPFWMPNQWPAHLMFLSLLWQFGGEPYAEDGSEATFDDDAGVEALTWMREQVEKGYSPDERRHRRPVPRVQERQELDHLGRHLADQRPRGVGPRLRHRHRCR